MATMGRSVRTQDGLRIIKDRTGHEAKTVETREKDPDQNTEVVDLGTVREHLPPCSPP